MEYWLRQSFMVNLHASALYSLRKCDETHIPWFSRALMVRNLSNSFSTISYSRTILYKMRNKWCENNGGWWLLEHATGSILIASLVIWPPRVLLKLNCTEMNWKISLKLRLLTKLKQNYQTTLLGNKLHMWYACLRNGLSRACLINSNSELLNTVRNK